MQNANTNMEKIIGLAFTDKATAQQLVQLPSEVYDGYASSKVYHGIIDAMRQQLADEQADYGLTRETLKLRLEQSKQTPIETAAAMGAYNRCHMNQCKPSEVTTLIDLLVKEHEKGKGLALAREGKHAEAVKAFENAGVDAAKVKAFENAAASKEVYEGATVQQEVEVIDLRDRPKLVRDFVNSMATLNDIIPPILHLASAYAVIGNIIGKRMMCNNKGTIYYPNLWAVCLAPTGSSKTGAVTPIERALEQRAIMPSSTMAGAYDVLGKAIGKKEWVGLSEAERDERMAQFAAEAMSNPNGKIIISDECTRVIDSLLGGWDSKRQTRDLGDFLKLTDSAACLPKQLAGEGFKAIYDCCVSFLGFTQNQTWQEKFGGEQFKSCGLFGRFLPFTSQYLALDGIADNHRPIATIIAEVVGKTDFAASKVDCYFGPPAPRGELDYIGRVMEKLGATANGKRFAELYPQDWDNLRGKIIGHAIKLSMIDAFLDDANRGKASVDCSPYFVANTKLAAACYLAYLQQTVEVSALSRNMERVRQAVAKHATISKRDLMRKLTFYNVGDFNAAIDALKEDGVIMETQRVNKNNTKTTVFSIK